MRFALGKTHDFKMYKEKGFVISEQIRILADSGFQGIGELHQNSQIPTKKTKNKPLDDEQKLENQKQASKRVPIEHCNRDFKIFRICGSKYRGKHQNYEDSWRLVGAIVNLKKSTKHLKNFEF